MKPNEMYTKAIISFNFHYGKKLEKAVKTFSNLKLREENSTTITTTSNHTIDVK